MRSSKGLSGKKNIWQNRIFAVIACLLIMVSGINLILLTGSNTDNVRAEPEGRMSRSSRQPNVQHESANDNINTADTVTYDPSGCRIIDVDIGTGDPWDYWKIPIDYGTKRYDINSDLIGVENSKKLIILLDNQGVSNGLLMTLYDAEKHELGKSVLAMQGGAQGEFTISGQVNSEVYIKIAPSGSGTGNYRLTIYNRTQDYNPSWDDRNTFSTATKRNITLGFQKVEYLSYMFDNADFYSFDVIKNQKIVLEMTPVSTCDFDLYLFDSTDPSNPVAWSIIPARGPLGKEKIVHISPSTNTYYLRVVVKIDGTYLGNNGNYTLTGSGNIPPYWNASFPDTYVVNEDSAPLTIEIEDAYYDVNPVDEIKYQIWNPIKGSGSWDSAPSSFNLENATIEQNEDIFTSK
ncbi:MAG: PPC domain-containing protein, partial [Thermoplasmata archaeon]|nr:PPC domain-containing protein [Thermoplasmata archaeon]